MTGKKRLFSLVAVLTAVSMVIVGVAVTLLYNSAFEQQRVRLIDTVKSQASLIKAVARFDQRVASQIGHEDIECDSFEASLSRLREAHDNFGGLGETGEFTLAKREGDQIIFLLNLRHHDDALEELQPILFSSTNAESMKLALRGESGTIVGLDYRGEQVLAAYEPVKELGLGLVAKIDISEIRVPFIRVGLISAGIAIVLILFGAVLFFRIGNPMVRDLIEKEARYRTLMNNLPVGVYRSTPEGKVISANPATLRCFGYDTEEEYLDKPAVDSFVDAERRRELLAALSENGSVSNFESQMVRKDGTVVWISTSAQATFGDDSRIEYFDGIEEDITERKQAEEALRKSEEKYRLIFETAANLINSVDSEGTLVDCNNRIEEVLGYKREEMIGQNMTIIIHPDYHAKAAELLAELKSTGTACNKEYKMIRKDGRVIDVTINSSSITDKQGNFVRSICIIDDITERKQAEERLIESERKLSFHLQNTPIAAIEWNLDFEVTEWNAAAEKTFGYTKEEALGRHAGDLVIPPSARDHVDAIWQGLLQNKGGFHSANENVTKDGRSIICDWHNTPLVDKAGAVTGVVSLTQDVTERERWEKALQESEQKYRNLVETSQDLIWKCDAKGCFTYLNPAWEKTHGYTVEKMLGRPFTDFQTPEVAARDTAKFGQHIACGSISGYETTQITKSGKTIHLVFNAIPLHDAQGEIIGTQGTAHDITERKQAQDAVAQNEERYRKLFNNAPMAYQSLDENGNFLEVNQTWCQTLGYSREEVIGRNFAEFIDPGFKDIFDRCFPIFKDAGSIDGVEHTMIKKDGSRIIASFIGQVGHYDDGSFKQTHCIFADVTERKRAEEALRESEEKHRLLFEHSNDPIFVHSLDGEILDVNSSACQMLGYSRDELLSMTLPSLHPAGELSRCAEAISITKQEGSTVFESLFITADGSVLNVSISSKIVDPIRGTIEGIVRDITETKRLQELESRAERLETAGTIAGQVAHDFNNLLAPIMAYPELIHEGLPHDHLAHAYLDSIEEAAVKIAEINQDLLTMGRRGHYNQEILDLNHIVLQAVKEMESRTKTLTCEIDLCQDLMKIKGGAAQIHRVLTNLMVNAQDAMGNIGQITIKTENYYADDTSIAFGRVPKGEYVKLTISDNGCGIPDDITQKILDPFFTTKTTDKKRGSGLGLSVVDAVMRDHSGHLDLSSRVGHGTAFYLYFPTTIGDTTEKVDAPLTIGSETVLIVDDDNVQREVSTRLLTRVGYVVDSAESGEKAIELLRENPRDLIVLDMVMPGGIDGAETYRQILQFCPSQKAIVLSGFSESDRVLEAQKLGAGAFVRKPVSRKVIAAAVRTELDRPVEIPAS